MQKPSQSGNNGATTNLKRTRPDLWIAAKAYSTSLLIVGVMIPVVASVIAVGLYLTLPNSPLPPFLGLQSSSQWYTLVYSSFLTGILWLLAAFPYCYLSTVS